MSDSDTAELKAEVAALSAVVAALFASAANLNSLGDADRLAFYAEAIARAGQADPERVAALVSKVARQANAATQVFRESH